MRPRISRSWILICLASLCMVGLPLTAGELVLKNGRVIRCHGPYKVKGDKVEYHDKFGNLYYVPVSKVDLARSKNEDKPAAKPKKKKKKPKPKAKKRDRFYEEMNNKEFGKDKDAGMVIDDNKLETYTYDRPGYSGLARDSWRMKYVLYDVYSAVENDDIAQLRRLLSPNLPLDEPVSSYRQPVLHVAVKNGNSITTNLLLKAGASPDVRNKYGDTALLAALKKNTAAHRQVAVTLLKGGADPNLADLTKIRPIHHVLSNRNTNMLEALIDHDVNLEVLDAWGNPVVINAVKTNDPASLKMLLDAGANVHASNKSGSNALLEAVKSGNPKLVHVLVRGGAAINTIQDGLSPLMLAAANDDLSMVEKLLGLGADPKVRHGLSETAATIAAHNGNVAIITVLKEKGIDVNDPPLLPAAVKANKVAMMRTLIEHGANPNMLDAEGNPPLVVAARAGNLEAVRTLINHGADVYLKSKAGYSAYLEAAGPQAEAIKSALRAKFKK